MSDLVAVILSEAGLGNYFHPAIPRLSDRAYYRRRTDFGQHG